ncbi:MAG TPA: alginate lyase family protein [Acidobacteriaceae bacterium]|nr:alginate lyase family protein [Acidobacteriaceae bacterium]
MDLHVSISRRLFCVGGAAAWAATAYGREARRRGFDLVSKTDRRRVLTAAAEYVRLEPKTITSFPTKRSPGGLHDFFSQADYFWPNPANPDGPYINRDGQSNPDNFNEHRKAMIALSIQMPALTAAWILTKKREYAVKAADHLRAWFVTPATRMNPNLEYSQGVHGVSTGRSYGIIDTLHLAEVARAASLVAPAALDAGERTALLAWFRDYLHWMETSEKGIAERDTKNNHAVCWALQASEYARLIGDAETRKAVRDRYKDVFVPDQMGHDGSFPRELARTKPYGYSIFNFDMMAMVCQSLVDGGEDLFEFALADGRGICLAAAFLEPYLKDKSAWPYRKDVQHFDAWPVRSPGLLFCGLHCHRDNYIDVWKGLNPDPKDPEIIRNYPVRQPLLWFQEAQAAA